MSPCLLDAGQSTSHQLLPCRPASDNYETVLMCMQLVPLWEESLVAWLSTS